MTFPRSLRTPPPKSASATVRIMVRGSNLSSLALVTSLNKEEWMGLSQFSWHATSFFRRWIAEPLCCSEMQTCPACKDFMLWQEKKASIFRDAPTLRKNMNIMNMNDLKKRQEPKRAISSRHTVVNHQTVKVCWSLINALSCEISLSSICPPELENQIRSKARAREKGTRKRQDQQQNVLLNLRYTHLHGHTPPNSPPQPD